MTRVLRVEHEDGFDLVDEDTVADHPIYGPLESLGTRPVAGMQSGEVLEQHKVRLPHIVYTDCELPPDYEGTPQELVHLIASWNDRHFDKPVAVSGDEAVGPKVAALLGVTYLGPELHEVEVPPMPPTEAALEMQQREAQTTTPVPSQEVSQ
jgi:hypothetical protein